MTTMSPGCMFSCSDPHAVVTNRCVQPSLCSAHTFARKFTFVGIILWDLPCLEIQISAVETRTNTPMHQHSSNMLARKFTLVDIILWDLPCLEIHVQISDVCSSPYVVPTRWPRSSRWSALYCGMCSVWKYKINISHRDKN